MPVSTTDIARSVEILRRFGARKVVLFGRAVHDPEAARDIDLAVDGIDGWEFFRAIGEVEDVLKIPVDMVSLRPPSRFTRYIEQNGRIVYESPESP